MAKNRFNFKMAGEDGNAFSIMGRFADQARRHGWTPEEIEEVMIEARSGDYDHLLATFIKYTDAC